MCHEPWPPGELLCFLVQLSCYIVGDLHSGSDNGYRASARCLGLDLDLGLGLGFWCWFRLGLGLVGLALQAFRLGGVPFERL
jgi:hypothetical protein